MIHKPTCLITGASRGIGLSISKSLSSTHNLILISKNINNLKRAKEIINSSNNVTIYPFDISKSFEISNNHEIMQLTRNVDILINCAGITMNKLLLHTSNQDMHDLIHTNLISTMVFTRLVVKDMIRNRNHNTNKNIINLASIVGYELGNSGQALYSATKAGIVGFTKSMAIELASRGVRVNAIAPGFIDTDMSNDLNNDLKKDLIRRIPLQRFGNAEDIALAVRYLLDAKYVTGQVLVVDGGLS